MGELPDQFRCELVTWEYVYDRTHLIAEQVRAEEWSPDTVVALARGGWFAGRVVCDLLGIDDLVSLKIEHYVGTGEQADEPQVRYPLPDGAITDKDILIIDDIADTGQSIQHAREYIQQNDPCSVKTATVSLLDTSKTEPDYVGEQLGDWAWIVFPWNFIEDMIDLITGVMEKSENTWFTSTEIKDLLQEYHGISHFDLEVVQPKRVDEVLNEMERRNEIVAGARGLRLPDTS
ncbi:phosphoribosyltransferase [Salinarchaeum sp. IM2453]|uniref:phosphoribosyltransferase n=1 Tax=Salinarchaeum sp. IM2453 TaxID=2862870 RepID=UPI001C83E102|nr:phosphoribosyltransferase [Salinarchaeum sp. IM2453]QZA88758.1 phosphoribosyltransferase [Salinarchaeum sp. IM2453]